ncbi:hypothetical protein AC579_2839 [Pseudocercospora musae]|uniref:Uncharacterized protein n=1 Tax=Pseudocercospora musae TaxID=113226 RepID=A0A139GWD9_9PEZI|nr:hypothetical protein AC579_2839 [Pseudocercospora musae]
MYPPVGSRDLDLLARSFNRKIDYGASRSAPAIMTEQYADSLVATPKEKRLREERPSWADTVSKIQDVLSIPAHNNKVLEGESSFDVTPSQIVIHYWHFDSIRSYDSARDMHYWCFWTSYSNWPGW